MTARARPEQQRPVMVSIRRDIAKYQRAPERQQVSPAVLTAAAAFVELSLRRLGKSSSPNGNPPYPYFPPHEFFCSSRQKKKEKQKCNLGAFKTPKKHPSLGLFLS